MATTKEKTISGHKPTSSYKIGTGYKPEKVDQKGIPKWSVDQKKNRGKKIKDSGCGMK
ncbi:MAG TPA: hypothetical protein P5136_00010 [Methanofastidiosum sp.]|nr:hypothetical protein [Methanofastidiosum sp.]